MDRFGVTGFAERAWAFHIGGRRGRVFDEALQALGLDHLSPDLVHELVEIYRVHPPVLKLFEDADCVLRQLVADGVPTGLITDGPLASQEAKIAALGLRERMDAVITTDTWGREFWKPHVRAFERVAELLGSDAASLVYVADNPSKDFIAPRQLGWRTLRIRRSSGEHASSEPADARACPDVTVEVITVDVLRGDQ
jgi:putative hydrolase of the HAD superfamily